MPDELTFTEQPLVARPRKVVIGSSVSVRAAEALDTLAFNTRTTVSGLIREAVYEYLERRGYNKSDEDDAA